MIAARTGCSRHARCAAACLAVAMLLASSGVLGEKGGGGASLVFSGFDGTSWDLWQSDGEGAHRITAQRDAASPAVAKDGRIAFTDASGAIWVRSANGRFAAVTGAPTPCDHPAWSPDAGRLAFACFRFDARQDDGALWVADLESGEVTALYDGPGLQKSPAWSPDGRTLAFVTGFRLSPTRVIEQIWTVDTQSGEAVRVFDEDGAAIQPAWSPDGRRLAFASDHGGNLEIWVMDLESGRVRALTSHPAYDADPAWSPDGRQVAFESTRGGELEIWTVAADGGPARRRVAAGRGGPLSARSPDWRRHRESRP